MSLIITLYVREGIVMASDSRLSLNVQQESPQGQSVLLSVGQSDSNYKTFLTPTRVGISTCGAAEINGVPVAGYVESFINDIVAPKRLEVDQVAQETLKHFQSFTPSPAIMFHVAGYKAQKPSSDQQVWVVEVAKGSVQRVNPPGQQGASWSGEADILARLLQPVGQLDPAGKVVAQFPVHPIPWGFFTLQDAIDFAIFAVRSTIDAIRFQPRAKTVGGPIDVLVIKPTEAMWVQRKALRATTS
ncbi:MAG: hypothetical protein LLG93_01525 [Deltaproteobacteria bacterium]|nr:hypothetical protein [Deltaproteobacteria bacterium]